LRAIYCIHSIQQNVKKQNLNRDHIVTNFTMDPEHKSSSSKVLFRGFFGFFIFYSLANSKVAIWKSIHCQYTRFFLLFFFFFLLYHLQIDHKKNKRSMLIVNKKMDNKMVYITWSTLPCFAKNSKLVISKIPNLVHVPWVQNQPKSAVESINKQKGNKSTHSGSRVTICYIHTNSFRDRLV